MTLLESLSVEGNDILIATNLIIESVAKFDQGAVIVETADSVLGALAAKLRAGGTLSPQDVEEYSVLYASLSLLANADVRAGFNIDLAQPQGQAKFSTILNDVGTDPAVTREVGRVATETGQSRLNQVRKELQNFNTMKPIDQQLYVNRINKLRLAYERARSQLAQKNLPQVDVSRLAMK